MIQTGRSRVAWHWVFLMNLPWVATSYVEMCSGQPLTFTLRKFIDSPRLISFLLSINILFNFMVGVFTSFLSDRIWTRFGRRRPFLILGWTGVAVCLLLVPMMKSIWSLAVLIVIYQFFQDVAKSVEPLYNEVIPPKQRGRAYTIRSILFTLNGMLFSAVMIKNWDQEYDLSRMELGHVTGEQFTYWVGAVFLAAVVLFLVFFVHENKPVHEPARPRITGARSFCRQFIRDIFGDRHAWMIYMIYVCPSLAAAGTGPMLTLVQTDQLGYSKSLMGSFGFYGMCIGMGFVLVAGWLTDRVSRLKLFQLGLIVPALVNYAMFILFRFVFKFDMSIWWWFAFTTVGGAFSCMTSVSWGPLIYDYIPKNRMGSISAGFAFISGISGFLLMNLAGQWVHYSTAILGNPARGGTYDYSSVFHLMLVFSILAFALTMRFAREVKAGRVLPLGRMDVTTPGQERGHSSNGTAVC